MPGLTAADTGPIVELINAARAQASAQFRANMLVQVATLKLLIDTKKITVDKAIQQINDTRQAFAKVFDREDVAIWTQWAIDLLRGEVPLHGSPIDQRMQQAERAKRQSGPAAGKR
jgi:hypothetical protein